MEKETLKHLEERLKDKSISPEYREVLKDLVRQHGETHAGGFRAGQRVCIKRIGAQNADYGTVVSRADFTDAWQEAQSVRFIDAQTHVPIYNDNHKHIYCYEVDMVELCRSCEGDSNSPCICGREGQNTWEVTDTNTYPPTTNWQTISVNYEHE